MSEFVDGELTELDERMRSLILANLILKTVVQRRMYTSRFVNLAKGE